ncbi:hypothetical protein BDR07DRAFT_1310308, partial [Suillus spraguei]
PWEPFQTWLDFEVTEIALEAAMTKDQTNWLFDLICHSACGKEVFTLQTMMKSVHFGKWLPNGSHQ